MVLSGLIDGPKDRNRERNIREKKQKHKPKMLKKNCENKKTKLQIKRIRKT